MKKILSLLLSFLLVFTSMGNAVLAYNSQNIGSNQFVSMLKNKQITKQGLAYLLKTSLSKDELSKLQNGTKAEKTTILKKFLKGGISSSQLSYLQNNGMISLGGAGISSSQFLQPLQAGIYKVNFKDISKNGGVGKLKAGEVQAKFIGKANFPQKFILPKGFSYEVKIDALQNEFKKTKALQDKIKNIKVDIGQVVLKEPELRVLPDRIEYVKKLSIVFENDKQLRNIKANLSNEFGNADINSMIREIKQVNLDNIQELKLGKLTPLQQQRLNISGLSVVSTNYSHNTTRLSNISTQTMYNAYNSSLFKKAPGVNKIKKDIFARFNQLSDTNLDKEVVSDCLKKGNLTKQQINNCRDKNTFKRVIETEEVISYSLIPSTIEDIRKNKKSFVAVNPSDVEISKNDIISRFEKLQEINANNKQIGDDYQNINNENSQQNAVDIFAREDYCEQKFKGKTGENGETEQQLIEKCKNSKVELLKKTPKTFKQDLLNGFTIGESKAYSWGVSASVYVPLVGSFKVFETKLTLSYGYGFGIRIPIHVEGGIDDDKVYAFAKGNINKGEYQTWIKANTLDANSKYYRKLLKNEDYIYGGKEFVFEFTANANIYVWIKGIGGGDVDIPLVSSLIVGLVAVSTSLNDGDINKAMEEVASFLGLQKGNAVSFITYLATEFLDSLINLNETDENANLTLNIGITKEEFKTLFKALLTYLEAKYGDSLTENNSYQEAKQALLNMIDEMEVDENGYVTNLRALRNTLSNPKVDEGINKIIDLLGELVNIDEFIENNTSEDERSIGNAAIKAFNTFATIIQSTLLTHMIKNNGIDMSKNFKPPFAGATIPLYRLESPEIPLYTDGFFKLVSKLGVKSKLGGRITAKCEEVNSIGACPKNTDSSLEANLTETAITYNYDNSRLHINTTEKYKGKGYAIDGPENEMQYDPILDNKYSKFGIKFKDFRYHPELIFTLFTKAGAGVHAPYIGWVTYWTPDIDLYTLKFSSDSLYLGQHDGTIGVFDMTQDSNREVNRVYTVLPPKMSDPSYIGYDLVGFDHMLKVLPKSNTIGGNNVYYKIYENTSDNREPACGEVNGTKLYQEGKNVLWTTYKKDLQNYKVVKVGTIACNALYETKTNVVKKDLNLENVYHIPFFVLEDRTKTNSFAKVEKGTTLNVDNDEGLYLTMNSKTLSGEIVKSDNTKEYIKYKIARNKNDLNLTCENGTLYNGEKIKFSKDIPFASASGTTISLGKSGIQKVGLGKGAYIKVIKCAIRNDGSTFQSLPRTIHVVSYSSEAHDEFVDKLQGGAVMQKVKVALEKLGDIRAGTLGGINKVGGGYNPLDFYGANGYGQMNQNMKNQIKNQLQSKVGLNNGMFNNIGDVLNNGINTKGVNPQNQNPWENQNGVNKNLFSIPELQEKIPGLNNKNVNFNNLVVKTVNSRFPGCNKNDVKIGNTIWASCDLKGKEENDNVKKFQDRWYFKGSSINNNICGEGYRLPTESELDKIDLWWYNKLNFNKKGVYRYHFIPGKLGAYVYTALDKYKRNIVKWVNNYDLNGGYYGPFYTTVSGLDTNDYYTVRCVKKDTNQQNENNQNNNSQQNQNFNMQQSQEYQYGDGIQRKYAKTRFPGCKENDIVIGNKVFAMCNSKKDEGGKSVVNGSENAKDKHGWEFGRYYFGYYGCESGYRRMTENDLKGINNVEKILKIPYAGYKGNNSAFIGVNNYGLYMLDSFHSLIFSENKYGYEKNFKRMYYNYKTVRCIRNTPATAEELGQLNNTNQQNLSSSDEYVNDKLDEINKCFLNTYNNHLKNIDDTIKKFNDTMNKSSNKKTKEKYVKAIKKLEEIKRLFILRYKNILDYKK